MAKTSEAQLRAVKKYDEKNSGFVTVKASKELIELFKSLCAENGTTPNAALKEAIERYVDDHRHI